MTDFGIGSEPSFLYIPFILLKMFKAFYNIRYLVNLITLLKL